MPERDVLAARAASAHHQELALFLALHFGREPAVFWPEHEHPACHPDASAADLDALAEGIAQATGHTVRVVGHSERGILPGGRARHVLVHQTAGSGDWSASEPGSGASPAFRARLRAGEVLYLPAGRNWSGALSGGARQLLSYIDPGVAGHLSTRAGRGT